jgi:hypothetical protein
MLADERGDCHLLYEQKQARKVRKNQHSGWCRSLSSYAFLERALEKSPKHTDLSDEMLNMNDRAKQAYQVVAELNRDIPSLAQEFPKTVK